MQKFRWSRVYESSEEELTALLAARGITAKQIAAEADSDDVVHQTKWESTIWCAEGSLTVITSGSATSLQPGDALRVPASTACTLQAGLSGYTCYVS